jgi:twitching motility protein PilI
MTFGPVIPQFKLMLVDFFQVELDQSLVLAIPLERTAEVLTMQWSELCPIPGICPELLGVSNQRGRLLWMLDLMYLLGLKLSEQRLVRTEKLTSIVLTRDNLRVAAFVSKLKGIISLDQSNIQSHHHPCFIGQAAVETEARLIPILNVDVVFQALQGNTLNSSSLVPLT